MKAPQAAASNLNPANLLTLLRLVLVPVFAVWMLEDRFQPACLVFAVAAATDFLDGWVARRFGYVTALGVFIDPLADKALQLTAFTLLSGAGVCPIWMAVLAWARELLVVSGFTLLALVARLHDVQASRLGKAGTLSQMGFLGCVLAVKAFWGAGGGRIGQGLEWALGAAVLLNFSAGLHYAYLGLLAYEKRQEDGHGPG
jgi:CDP-diacylglycerol--glycerol-3-phosphate 3-phosphatidyltransferase